jgi:hypothetical protein
MIRISVLLSDSEEDRFSAYCRERGHKKSTLIARLIREYLDREGYASQPSLIGAEADRRAVRGEIERQAARVRHGTRRH